MKILTIIGARPQFIKSAAISREIQQYFSKQISEVVVHTGQHYDDNMSGVFFSELGLKTPDYRLDLNLSGNRMEKMTDAILEIVKKEQPDAVLVYGDTDSTLAGARAADTLNIPVVHIEAGLRSFNDNMPEEKNRKLTDELSTLLFSPTETGIANLKKEGFKTDNKPPFSKENPGVYHCGDIMYDNSLNFAESSDKYATIVNDLGLPPEFILVTVHRNYNTDAPERLAAIFEGLLRLVERGRYIVFPLHPRTKKMLHQLSEEFVSKIENTDGLRLIEPVSFLDIIALEKNAQLIMTDSGGMQKEAFFFKKPCVILREETEWVELVQNGNAKLCGADTALIVQMAEALLKERQLTFPPFYGNGKAAHFICNEILIQL